MGAAGAALGAVSTSLASVVRRRFPVAIDATLVVDCGVISVDMGRLHDASTVQRPSSALTGVGNTSKWGKYKFKTQCTVIPASALTGDDSGSLILKKDLYDVRLLGRKTRSGPPIACLPPSPKASSPPIPPNSNLHCLTHKPCSLHPLLFYSLTDTNGSEECKGRAR